MKFISLKKIPTLDLAPAFLKDVSDFNKPALLITEKSLFSYFYCQSLRNAGFSFSEITTEQFFSGDHEYTNTLVVFPIFKFRIFNINFNTTLAKEFGSPYLVHISQNNIVSSAQLFLNKSNHYVFNPLIQFPHFFKSYLNHPVVISWLHQASIQTAHNDEMDRNLVMDLIDPIGQLLTDKYFNNSTEQLLIQHDLSNLIKPSNNLEYCHYPIHSFYKKYLGEDLKINLAERSIYGDVNS